MSTNMSEEEREIYEEAKKRVDAKTAQKYHLWALTPTDFYRNLGFYIVVNIGLVLIWAFAAGGGYPWFAWTLGIWGIVVLLNFLQVFVFSKRTGRDKKAIAIEEEAERIRKKRS